MQRRMLYRCYWITAICVFTMARKRRQQIPHLAHKYYSLNYALILMQHP